MIELGFSFWVFERFLDDRKIGVVREVLEVVFYWVRFRFL